MPVPRRCSGCGAALGQPTDDDLTIVCGFCGLRHDINQLAGFERTLPVSAPVRQPMSGTARAVITAILALTALSVAAGLYVAYRAATAVTTLVTTPSGVVTTPERERPVELAALKTLTNFSWNVVATPLPPGGVTPFDPVAELPWAMTIARAWAADAALTRIDVDRVSSTGIVDVSADEPAGYRFHSRSRLRRWKQDTDAGSTSQTASGLMLQVQGTTVRVLQEISKRDEPEAAEPVSLPLPELLVRARKARGFLDRPFYAAYMIHVRREGWAWYFQTPSGDSFPRVRARDGRVHPF